MTNTKIISNKYAMPILSVKAKTIVTVVSVALAILLPQLVHMIGISSGSGSALGEILLPMHLPVILAGLVAGPYVGLITGFLAPIISFGITGMPSMVILPFITIELAVYGFLAGAMSNVKINVMSKVLIAQIVGRVVRALAILAAVYIMGNNAVKVSIIWTSIKTGFVGIILQWALIPVVVMMVRKVIDNERSAN